MDYAGRVTPARSGQFPTWTLVPVGIGLVTLLGIGGLAYYIRWRRRREVEEVIREHLRKLSAEIDAEGRRAIAVEFAGDLVRGVITQDVIVEVAGEPMASNIGTIAKAIAGIVEINAKGAALAEIAQVQVTKEEAAARVVDDPSAPPAAPIPVEVPVPTPAPLGDPLSVIMLPDGSYQVRTAIDVAAPEVAVDIGPGGVVRILPRRLWEKTRQRLYPY